MNILKSQIKPFLLIKSSANENLLSISQKKDNSLKNQRIFFLLE